MIWMLGPLAGLMSVFADDDEEGGGWTWLLLLYPLILLILFAVVLYVGGRYGYFRAIVDVFKAGIEGTTDLIKSVVGVFS